MYTWENIAYMRDLGHGEEDGSKAGLSIPTSAAHIMVINETCHTEQKVDTVSVLPQKWNNWNQVCLCVVFP